MLVITSIAIILYILNKIICKYKKFYLLITIKYDTLLK